jgi:hypothetical protein
VGVPCLSKRRPAVVTQTLSSQFESATKYRAPAKEERPLLSLVRATGYGLLFQAFTKTLSTLSSPNRDCKLPMAPA